VAENGEFAGSVLLGDTVKPDAVEALAGLRRQGVRRFVLLTGDALGPAEATARELGISEVHSGLLPHEKLEKLESILEQEARMEGRTLFVGDGVNDAPVLARADAGIAMGAGADAALETADAVLMTGEPARLAEAVRRARRTRAIVRQNIVFALGFKLAFLALGAFGLANMWEAVVADVGVALLAVLNSTRALK
jgi:Cd2+/Zn2+-exporting ATPase